MSTTRDDDDETGRSFEPSVEADLRPLAVENLQEIFAAIQDELPRLHRKQDVEGLVRSVRCHVEARMGASLEEQVAEYGGEASEGEGEKAAVRARNRVYQYRKRGREAACEALSSLVAQGRYAPEDVDDARRLLGCDVQGSRSEKAEKVLS